VHFAPACMQAATTVSAEIQPGNGSREDHVDVSTVVPPCQNLARSPLTRDRIGDRSCIFWGRIILSPQSVCSEIPSRKQPRYCPPCGPVSCKSAAGSSPPAFRRASRTCAKPQEDVTARRGEHKETFFSVFMVYPHSCLLSTVPTKFRSQHTMSRK